MYLAAAPVPRRRRRPARASCAPALARVVARRQPPTRASSCSPRSSRARAASTCPRSGRRTSCASSSAPRRASRATRSAASRRPTSRRGSRAQALLAMVESHIMRELVLKRRRRERVDPRARRAVVARGLLAAWRRGPALALTERRQCRRTAQQHHRGSGSDARGLSLPRFALASPAGSGYRANSDRYAAYYSAPAATPRRGGLRRRLVSGCARSRGRRRRRAGSRR